MMDMGRITGLSNHHGGRGDTEARRKARWRLEPGTGQAVSEDRDLEIDDKAYGKVGCFQVSQYLTLELRGRFIDRFEFQDQMVIDEQVDSSLADGFSFVIQAHGDFGSKRDVE
jgi:hypothetical protein